MSRYHTINDLIGRRNIIGRGHNSSFYFYEIRNARVLRQSILAYKRSRVV